MGNLVGQLTPVGSLKGTLSIGDEVLNGIITIPIDFTPPAYNGEYQIIQNNT